MKFLRSDNGGEESSTKLDPKATKCIFLAYQHDVKGYRLWDPVGGKLIVKRDVSFNESRSLKEGEIVNAATNEGHLSSTNTIEGEIYHEISHDGPEGGAPQMTGETEEQDFALEKIHEEQHIAGEPPPESSHNDQPKSSTARPTRVHRASERYGTLVPPEHVVKNENLLVNDLGEALITEDGSPYSFVESQ
ncbi:hypothetical protein AXG93_1617s1000 [Marchantia polymorpha subsp. ruderalis]|uniref:Retroviral polymerase SH3-like domain-containing protein n=1 Tax=Marchantia polymorpha subsp. ruderalis TaxID=1480154 RepID=A0A176W969_MARPO|nr:hypothetical protein AXG93_1617s1000 [Marchantia polymorpha subsp. ruderalis]